MTDSDGIPELPKSTSTRRAIEVREVEILPAEPSGRRLTESQQDRLIEGGVEAAKGAIEITKKILEIFEIRQQAEADVVRIEAETEKLRVLFMGEVARIEAERGQIIDRGKVAVDIIRELTPAIRDANVGDEVKKQLVAELPVLVREVLGDKK